MDNKKLLKFLFKDIAEIEELFVEKGSEGFDEFEIEFIQSRFKGAKQLIQILSEKENKQLENIRPRPVIEALEDKREEEPKAKKGKEVPNKMTEEEAESLQELSRFEEEIKESDPLQSELAEEKEVSDNSQVPVESHAQSQSPEAAEEIIGEVQGKAVGEEQDSAIQRPVTTPDDAEPGVDLDDEEQVDEANNRLGDRFTKEKSVNELLGNKDNSKLEYKISNSPVDSIKAAIGINDRYQYIRELFDGKAEVFSKTVDELDRLNTIQEAVTYLQQNYKWKKNDTSLKFVNLVKRRFPNG